MHTHVLPIRLSSKVDITQNDYQRRFTAQRGLPNHRHSRRQLFSALSVAKPIEIHITH